MKSSEEYKALAEEKSHRSPMLFDLFKAFLTGGAICALGQFISSLWEKAGLDPSGAGTLTSVTLIFMSALLTGIGVYDRVARFGGAGTLVPITGFSNAVTSAAVEFRSEGLLTGTAIKMFTIAGPVIVYGVAASVLYGIILLLAGYGPA